MALVPLTQERALMGSEIDVVKLRSCAGVVEDMPESTIFARQAAELLGVLPKG